MTSHKHNGIAFTVRKLDGEFRAAYRDCRGNLVDVTSRLRRVAVACIKSHIDDED